MNTLLFVNATIGFSDSLSRILLFCDSVLLLNFTKFLDHVRICVDFRCLG